MPCFRGIDVKGHQTSAQKTLSIVQWLRGAFLRRPSFPTGLTRLTNLYLADANTLALSPDMPRNASKLGRGWAFER